jgi:hypothetical protein
MVQPTIKYVVWIVVLVIVIVSVDSLFLRNLFWERLIVNIVIVLAFLAIFLKYIR